MGTLHNVVMNNSEYSFWLSVLDKMERDQFFKDDAGKLRAILSKDIPVEDDKK